MKVLIGQTSPMGVASAAPPWLASRARPGKKSVAVEVQNDRAAVSTPGFWK